MVKWPFDHFTILLRVQSTASTQRGTSDRFTSFSTTRWCERASASLSKLTFIDGPQVSRRASGYKGAWSVLCDPPALGGAEAAQGFYSGKGMGQEGFQKSFRRKEAKETNESKEEKELGFPLPLLSHFPLLSRYIASVSQKVYTILMALPPIEQLNKDHPPENPSLQYRVIMENLGRINVMMEKLCRVNNPDPSKEGGSDRAEIDLFFSRLRQEQLDISKKEAADLQRELERHRSMVVEKLQNESQRVPPPEEAQLLADRVRDIDEINRQQVQPILDDMGKSVETVNSGVDVAQGTGVALTTNMLLSQYFGGIATLGGAFATVGGTIIAGGAAMLASNYVGKFLHRAAQNIPLLNKIPERGWSLATKGTILGGALWASGGTLWPFVLAVGGVRALQYYLQRHARDSAREAQAKAATQRMAARTTPAGLADQSSRQGADEPHFSIAA